MEVAEVSQFTVPIRQHYFSIRVVLFFAIYRKSVLQAVNDLVTELEQANITCQATITFAESDFKDQLRMLRVRQEETEMCHSWSKSYGSYLLRLYLQHLFIRSELYFSFPSTIHNHSHHFSIWCRSVNKIQGKIMHDFVVCNNAK